MLMNEELYVSIIHELEQLLSNDIQDNFVKLRYVPYKENFTQKGEWDKRKKYFNIDIRIHKKSEQESLMKRIADVFLKIDQFIKDNNNDKVYMLADFSFGNQYSNEFKIVLKFISYDLAAKILLNQ